MLRGLMGKRDYSQDWAHTALVRLLGLALRLGAGQEVTSTRIRGWYGVSRATAKRDLQRLECAMPVTVDERGPMNCREKVLTLEAPHRGFIKLLRASAA